MAKTEHERDPRDFYRTPATAVEAILPHLTAGGIALDPCAGDGAILDVLKDSGRFELVAGLELDINLQAACAKKHACLQVDAFVGDWCKPDIVVMNPPFKHALPFLERALKEAPEVACLLRLGMLAGIKRSVFWQAHPADVFVLPKRPSFTGGGCDFSEYMWAVWGTRRGGRWQVLA